jgi:hypothetical protein
MATDSGLLHMIADRAGRPHNGFRTEKLILDALSKQPGELVPGYTRAFTCRRQRTPWPAGNARRVTLTGRTRELGGGSGSRSTNTAREYRCEFGHTGWSRHVELAGRAGAVR